MSHKTWSMLLVCIVLSSLYVKFVHNQKHRYGTKTPYTDHGDLNVVKTPMNCRTVQLNMVMRHGSRYPSSATRTAMKETLQNLNKIHKTRSYRYNNLTIPWSLPKEFNVAESIELSKAGEQEMYELGRRFRARFPELFKRPYWNSLYKFVSSNTPRTVQSSAAFGYGLFERNGTIGPDNFQPLAVVVSGMTDQDKLLRNYNTCPRYDKEIVEGSGLREWKEFGRGSEMKKVISNLEKNLGVEGKMKITADMAQDMYWLCAFTVLNGGDTSWCSVFSEEDQRILEYYDDLSQYYRHSYGNDIGYRISCPLVDDIVNTIKSYTTTGKPLGVFRDGHIGTMTSLQSILGLFKDSTPLKASNYETQGNRTFRVSTNVPMAGNLAFVLYKCGDTNTVADYKVQVIVNEREVRLPCCRSNDTCSLQSFLSCYEHVGESCDFKFMCRLLDVSAGVVGYSPLNFSTLFVALLLLWELLEII